MGSERYGSCAGSGDLGVHLFGLLIDSWATIPRSKECRTARPISNSCSRRPGATTRASNHNHVGIQYRIIDMFLHLCDLMRWCADGFLLSAAKLTPEKLAPELVSASPFVLVLVCFHSSNTEVINGVQNLLFRPDLQAKLQECFQEHRTSVQLVEKPHILLRR